MMQPYSPDGPPPPQQMMQPYSPDGPPPPQQQQINQRQSSEPNIKNPELKTKFDALPEKDKKVLMELLEKKKTEKKAAAEATAQLEAEELSVGEPDILQVEKDKEKEKVKPEISDSEESTTEANTKANSGQTKTITISPSALEGSK
jgi:hypothetical protein